MEAFLLRQYSSDAYEPQQDGGVVIGEDAVLASGSGRLGISYSGYQFGAGTAE